MLLDSKELLTTLILLLIDENTEEGIVLAIGDGFVAINGDFKIFEQDNKPDYVGFHITEDFELFYNSQNQLLKFTSITDVSIATDGLFSFEQFTKNKTNEDKNLIEYLTTNKEHIENSEMLHLKLKYIENQLGKKPTDDFAMIRIIK